MNPAECEHPQFRASVAVQRLTDEADAGRVLNFLAEVTVTCDACGEPFVGPPCGLSFTSPTVNVGATTLHAPIAPGELRTIPSRIAYEVPGKPS